MGKADLEVANACNQPHFHYFDPFGGITEVGFRFFSLGGFAFLGSLILLIYFILLFPLTLLL